MLSAYGTIVRELNRPTTSYLMRLKFRKPPVDELVIGSYFPPIEQLQAQHIGLFWAGIIDELPTCVQQPPLVEILQNESEIFPLPRFWFISADDAILIQVQRNAFIANWRRRGENATYPHFETISEFFGAQFNNFRTFAKERLGFEMQQVASLELAYINFLRAPEIKSVADFATLIPGINQLRIPEDLGEINGYSSTYNVNVSADMALRVSLSRAKRLPENAEGLRLEIRAKGIPEPPDWTAVSPWFDKAHDYISDLFLTVTSPEAQRSWEPIEGGMA